MVTLVTDINTDPSYRRRTDSDRALSSSSVLDDIGHSDKQWPLDTTWMDPGGGPDLKHSHGQFLFFFSFFNHLLKLEDPILDVQAMNIQYIRNK